MLHQSGSLAGCPACRRCMCKSIAAERQHAANRTLTLVLGVARQALRNAGGMR